MGDERWEMGDVRCEFVITVSYTDTGREGLRCDAMRPAPRSNSFEKTWGVATRSSNSSWSAPRNRHKEKRIHFCQRCLLSTGDTPRTE